MAHEKIGLDLRLASNSRARFILHKSANNFARLQCCESNFKEIPGSMPNSVAVDPTGQFAYVANYGSYSVSAVSAYTINATSGALTPMTGSPFAAGTNPYSVTTVRTK